MLNRGNVIRALMGTMLALATCGSVRAAVISYGNFSGPPLPPGISFQNVTESSGTDPVPLYGPPHKTATGLDFDPVGFVATASGGTQDTTDGQLNYIVKGTVVPGGSASIKSLNLSESGDYTLVGAGTTATQALAGAIVAVKVTEIDGNPVTPFNLAPSNASVGFNLIGNPGIVQPWSLGLSVNVDSQIAGIPHTIGVTGLEVVINNQLLALSESGSVSFIAKKDFVVGVVAEIQGVVPEPSSVALLGIAMCGMIRRRRAA
jgi:hypothetical protein